MATRRIPLALTRAAQTLGVVAAYVAFGKLALLLAVPPGHAAPVWPSAGLALAAILLFGYRAWPAVLLGSFLVNVGASSDASGPASILRTVLLAAMIGAGAATQAVLGTYLIRRLGSVARSFTRPRELLQAALVAGPLTCLVGASVGVAALSASGAIDAEHLARNWTTWWLGDTLGVLMIFPLAAGCGVDFGRTRPWTRFLVWGPLVIGTLLVAALYLDTLESEQSSARLEFERRAAIMARALERSATSKLDIVRSAVSLFNSSDAVSRSEFRSFVGPLLERDAGLLGLSWNARISADDRSTYERAARSDGLADFEITERGADGRLMRAGVREVYVPVSFIEPLATNRRALGFDLASDPTRVEVLERVRDTGRILATPPITLIQDSGNHAGFLVFAPVYAEGSSPQTDAAGRRENPHSFVSAVFKSGQLVEDALLAFDKEGIDCRLVDATDPSRPRVLYPAASVDGAAEAARAGVTPAGAQARPIRWSTVFDLAGRRWSAEFWPTSRYATDLPAGRPLAVLTGGLFFTSLLGGLLLTLAGRASTIERVVDSRTAELSKSNVDLCREITERTRAEAGLQQAHDLLQLEVQERKLAEAALRVSESRFRAVFRASTIGIAVGGPDGQLLDVNGYIGQMLGLSRDELIGRTLEQLLPDRDGSHDDGGGDSDRLRTVAVERRFRRVDGRFGWAMMRQTPVLDDTGAIQYFVGIVEDITARRRFDEHLSKSQKLESVGLLAGGIAHDFNNLLTVVLGNLSLLRDRMQPPAPMLRFMDQAERALSRATGLTRQLLTFAKGGAPVTRVVTLPALAKEAAEFALGGANVSCSFQLPDDLWSVKADPGQLHQVVSNLLINAAQSMPDGGTVCVRARNERVEADDSPVLEPGDYVKLSVQDRGVGIPWTIRSRIFDPYFTTKPNGSGLGLPTAYSIVRKHGGDIAMESEPGVGTVFHVYLPASTTDHPDGRIATPFPPGAHTGSGRILIMDDEEAIRSLAGEILTRLGYEVDLARDGADAVSQVAEALESGNRFAAVILDLTVPGGMGGREAIGRLKKIDPQLRAIVSSGYSDDPVLSSYRQYGFSGVVAKPYRVEDLANAVRRAMAHGT